MEMDALGADTVVSWCMRRLSKQTMLPGRSVRVLLPSWKATVSESVRNWLSLLDECTFCVPPTSTFLSPTTWNIRVALGSLCSCAVWAGAAPGRVW